MKHRSLHQSALRKHYWKSFRHEAEFWFLFITAIPLAGFFAYCIVLALGMLIMGR